jgi:hypothetical protein
MLLCCISAVQTSPNHDISSSETACTSPQAGMVSAFSRKRRNSLPVGRFNHSVVPESEAPQPQKEQPEPKVVEELINKHAPAFDSSQLRGIAPTNVQSKRSLFGSKSSRRNSLPASLSQASLPIAVAAADLPEEASAEPVQHAKTVSIIRRAFASRSSSSTSDITNCSSFSVAGRCQSVPELGQVQAVPLLRKHRSNSVVAFEPHVSVVLIPTARELDLATKSACW